MIKDLFLPIRLRRTYLFPQRIVAFEITTESVRATMVHAHRSLATLSAYAEEPYSMDKPDSLAHAVTLIKERLGRWDQTYISIPGNKVVFKRLVLPFTNHAKIKLVLPFELESVLPYPVSDAVFDVLVTPSETTQNEADVFIAIIKKEILDGYIQPFINLGLIPKRVTTGGIELYGFLKLLNDPAVLQGNVIVANIDFTATDILLLTNGHLVTTRAIGRGISQATVQHTASALEQDEQKKLAALITDMRFTIQALMKNERLAQLPEQIILVGPATQMEGIGQIIQQELGIKTAIIHPHDIMRTSWINMDHQGVLPDKFITSFAAALPWTITDEFDLGASYHEAFDFKQFQIKFFVGISLIGLLFATIFVFSMLSTKKLRKELNLSRTEIEKRLTTEFNIVKKSGKSGVKSLINETQQRLIVNEGVWSAMTTDRYSFLKYLQALSTHIDRQELGLELKKLTIKRDAQTGEDRLTLDGTVKNYDALRKLESALKDSKLFTSVPRLEDTKFSLSLVINKEGDF